jgi:hypothetical protein
VSAFAISAGISRLSRATPLAMRRQRMGVRTPLPLNVELRGLLLGSLRIPALLEVFYNV